MGQIWSWTLVARFTNAVTGKAARLRRDGPPEIELRELFATALDDRLSALCAAAPPSDALWLLRCWIW